MIREINIKNFKSIVDLTLDLGRFNVIIGANGCGKTNILEAIAFAAAANAKKLSNEFLMNRDLRVTKPELMVNAFEEGAYEFSASFMDLSNGIMIFNVKEDGVKERVITLVFNKSQWVDMSLLNYPDLFMFLFEHVAELKDKNLDTKEELLKLRAKSPEKFDMFMNLFDYPQSDMDSFLVYHPDEKHLKEVKDSPIYPLGIKGEGLLQYLKEKSQQTEYKDMFETINEGLGMLDWFDGVAVPGDLLNNEYKLSIGDRYLRDSMHFFDQRSTNEGFMFLLFYLTLFNSKDTPPFFSIDNIETALNPRLCTELTSRLIHTSKEKEKQVILTTHSPYVLDGLDLSDDEVRLFVARRDIDGHTRLERIMYREDRNMPLSELWMSGLIGGLPDNF
jgi:predicted ATPase